MKKICTNTIEIKDLDIFNSLEEQYNITIPEIVKEFFIENNGGDPINCYPVFNGEEYEIRKFLSFNDNEEYSIFLPLKYYMEQSNNKMFPIALDSGDNYFCLNLEDNKLYLSGHEDDEYEELNDSFESFIEIISD